MSVVSDFGSEVDEIQERARDAYALLPCRDSEILRLRYPASDPRFFRLLIDSGSESCGWAVVLATSMHGHKQFGDLRVGTIVDCLAAGDEDYVVQPGTTSRNDELSDESTRPRAPVCFRAREKRDR